MLGHERVSAAADDQDWPPNALLTGAFCTPWFQTSTYWAATSAATRRRYGEPVELLFAEVGREFGSRGALRIDIAAEGAKRRDRFVGQLRTAERHRCEQHQSADPIGVLRGDKFGDLGSEALADDNHRPFDPGEDLAGLGGKRLQRDRPPASATDPLRVPNPGRS